MVTVWSSDTNSAEFVDGWFYSDEIQKWSPYYKPESQPSNFEVTDLRKENDERHTTSEALFWLTKITDCLQPDSAKIICTHRLRSITCYYKSSMMS